MFISIGLLYLHCSHFAVFCIMIRLIGYTFFFAAVSVTVETREGGRGGKAETGRGGGEKEKKKKEGR